jgi:hypothetical protein
MRNFKEIDGDMDYRLFEKTFVGRLTKCRYKSILKYCRVKTTRTHCGHEHDCCGCLFAESYSMKLIRVNTLILGFKIQVVYSYNY